MPGRYPSPLCRNCLQESETIYHRYISCTWVSHLWEWVSTLIFILDPMLTGTSDSDILRLNFDRGLRENAIIWLLSSYIEVIETEIILKNSKCSLSSFIGILKHKKDISRHQAIPELGLIPMIDWDVQGIG